MEPSQFEMKFKSYIKAFHLAQKGEKTLLAVSAGLDSVVMAHLFHVLKFPFALAHCNFKLRGSDSDEDEALVKHLAKTFAVPFYSISFDTAKEALMNKKSIQEIARDLRYQWLEVIRIKNGFTGIGVAHHVDDQVETVLHNMIRGTGIRGLRGMKPKRGKVIRPLLFARRNEIEDYARHHRIQYRVDQSNSDTKYSRNQIRHQLIPEIEKLNPGFVDTFRASIEHFGEIESIYNDSMQSYLKKLVVKKNGEIHIPIKLLMSYDFKKTLLYEIIRQYGFNTQQVNQILDAMQVESGKQFISSNYRLIRDRKFLIITQKVMSDVSVRLLSEKDTSLVVGEQKLNIVIDDKASDPIPGDRTIAWVDYKKLRFPLIVRNWKKGDYFYPIGMKIAGKNKIGKKKISDYLIDQKIPVHQKEKIRVIESDKKIVWVIGYRLDDRFKITDRTRKVYRIKITE